MTTRRCELQGGLRFGLTLALMTVVGLTLWPQLSEAQTQRGTRGSRGGVLERLIFAPDLVMSHQQEIGLSDEQKQVVIREMQQMQSDLVPLQIEMGEAAESLASLLRERRVDEAAVLATARRVMELEADVKARHLLLVVRIKNLLSSEQQATLRQIRARQRARQDRSGGFK